MKRIGAFSFVAISLLVVLSARFSMASDLSEVLFTKGMMYYDLGRYDLAIENFREAAREDPANLEIRKYLARAETAAAGAPSPIAFYEKAVKRDPQSASKRLDLALALYLEKRYDQALEHIEQANRLSPSTGGILFYRGLILTKKGRSREAVQDLQRARSLNPRLAQAANYYEAVNLLRLRERREALGLFQRVIAENPTTTYAAEAAEYLRVFIKKRFSARLTTGVEYDTNVPIVGEENTLGVPVDAPEKRQFRWPFSALLDYRFLDVGQWSFGARYGLYTSVHSDDSEFNVISNLAEVYGTWRLDRLYVRPFYYYRSVLLDTKRLSDTHALGGSAIYYSSFLNLAPEVYVRLQHREYYSPTTDDSDLDGTNFRGEYNQYLFFGGGRGYARVGVGWESNPTDGQNVDHSSYLLLAGLQYPLPWQMMFNFDFEFKNRDYSHTHTVFDTERRDYRYAFGWQLNKALGRGFDLKGRIAHIRNDSNIGDFDYDRQVYSLLLSWSY